MGSSRTGPHPPGRVSPEWWGLPHTGLVVSVKQRLYPSAGQEPVLVEWCHIARFTYNVFCRELADYVTAKAGGGGWVWEKNRDRRIVRLRHRLDWYAAAPSVVQQAAARDFNQAVSNWMAGRGARPTFKRKNDRAGGFVIRDLTVSRLNRRWGQVLVPKLGFVRFRLTRPWKVVQAASSARVSLRNGHWHVSFTTPPAPKQHPPGDAAVGLDRGVANTVATSDGELLSMPKLTAVQQARFVRLEQARARTVKGSRNRARIGDRLAGLRRRQDNLRNDWVEQTTTRLARTYGVVVVEDLNTAGMTRRPAPRPDPDQLGSFLPNRAAAKAALNRLILASHWAGFATRLEHKTRSLIRVDPRNTSRRCNACGHIASENRESQAVFKCVA